MRSSGRGEGKKKQIPHCVRDDVGREERGTTPCHSGEKGPGRRAARLGRRPYNYGSGFRRRGAAGELAEGGVAYVLEVGDADFAGVEAVGGEIA